MKLKFSVEDILRDNKATKADMDTYSQQGTLIDGKRLVTSDGESTRSESPDSTTSMNSDDVDKKSSRRIRTMIQQWQKELLETAFANHQYPTVHQYEALSKQLELPHYVTKVWFQNRRSKSRKEGTREQNRRKFVPYPTNGRPMMESSTYKHNVLREDELETIKHRLNPTFLQEQAQRCNCDECVAALRNSTATESSVLPQIPMREACNCGECINKRLLASAPMELRQSQQSSIDSRRHHVQYGLRTPKMLCSCEECMAQLRKMDVSMKHNMTNANAFYDSGRTDLGFQTQFLRPQNSPGTIRSGSTLHYLAVPNSHTYFNSSTDGKLRKMCNCINCYVGPKGSHQ